jgi:Ni/Fe-hydrogenase 1 B-type cytochrome subunit
MSTSAASSVHDPKYQKAIYVYEAPVRLWHWIHALSIGVLCVTGYFIANPLPSLGGEASSHFLMGNMRMIHFIAGYVFTIAFAVRIYWAIVGNKYSRELFILPVWKGAWWKGLLHELKYYAFLTRKSHKIMGHNPLAQSAMWVFNVLLTLFLIFTGFALYGEGLGLGSWADSWFGWVIPALDGSQNTKMLHLLGMWVMLVFVVIHIYMAIRADIMDRESSVSTIMGGWRMFKDDQP